MNYRMFRLGMQVKRLHTRNVAVSETVGHHTANVCGLLLALYAPALPPAALLVAALLHDAPEGYTGDVPANVKVDNPELKEALLVSENRFKDLLRAPVCELTSFEIYVLKFADSVELAYKCLEEMEMGNYSLCDVLSNAYSYAETACSRADGYRGAAAVLADMRGTLAQLKKEGFDDECE